MESISLRSSTAQGDSGRAGVTQPSLVLLDIIRHPQMPWTESGLEGSLVSGCQPAMEVAEVKRLHFGNIDDN